MANKNNSWLQPQGWLRDTDRPCVALGAEGAFDDMHLFAPCAAYEDGKYKLWYCGSRADVADRVFRMGLTTSADGVHFTKHTQSPVFAFGDGRHSVLTPTLLHNPDGSVHRENGRLRLWFSSTDFPSGDGRHTLHETTSEDGLTWTPPSEPQLENLYAPTILEDEGTYKLWYADVSSDPWCFRHAESDDGRNWRVAPDPVMVLDQPREYSRLFYPTVRKDDGLYLMWYGSYRPRDTDHTAIHFAVSEDGIHWRKNPYNPVFKPDPGQEWESHFTTSQSVMKLPDGSWRMWYASRTKPPFTHKYFAIGTARWPRRGL